MKFLPKHWLVIGFAVLMMLGAGLISFLLVHENDRKIAAQREQAQQLDDTIRALWDNAGRMESNADAAVIVSLLPADKTAQYAALKQYYLTRAGAKSADVSLLDVVKLAQTDRQQAVDSINDLYIQRVGLESDIAQREQANRIYANIAFLMQLISSLVLLIFTREAQHV